MRKTISVKAGVRKGRVVKAHTRTISGITKKGREHHFPAHLVKAAAKHMKAGDEIIDKMKKSFPDQPGYSKLEDKHDHHATELYRLTYKHAKAQYGTGRHEAFNDAVHKTAYRKK